MYSNLELSQEEFLCCRGLWAWYWLDEPQTYYCNKVEVEVAFEHTVRTVNIPHVTFTNKPRMNIFCFQKDSIPECWVWSSTCTAMYPLTNDGPTQIQKCKQQLYRIILIKSFVTHSYWNHCFHIINQFFCEILNHNNVNASDYAHSCFHDISFVTKSWCQ